MDRQREESADRARDRQSRLAIPLRPWHRALVEQFRIPGLEADTSGATGLASIDLCRARMVAEEAASPDAAIQYLPAKLGFESEGAEIDPENDLMWRYDMRRLEAEEVRDSILAVNGS